MKLLHQVLKKMYEDYAVIFPPADPKDVQKASVTLIKNGLPAIPSDYLELLTATNGFFWNGLELFSLTDQERENGAYTHTGILSSYLLQLSNPLLKKKLVIGSFPEELIVYDASKKEYQILDRSTYSVLLKLPRFFDVLYFYGRDLIEKSSKESKQTRF